MQTIWRAVKISQQRRLCNYWSILCLSKTRQGSRCEGQQFRECRIRHGFQWNITFICYQLHAEIQAGLGLSSAEESSQSPSKQGSTSVNCITACVTAAVTWLTPVWARERMEGDRVTFLHEKLSDLGFSLCSCMYLVCLSSPPRPPPPVYSVVLKSALCRYTFQISSPRWHEKVLLRTETKLNQFWPRKWPGFYPYVPKRTKCGKDTVCKTLQILAVRVREQGTRGNGVISSSMSENSLHHSTVLKEKTIHLWGTSHQFFTPSE